jgi:hypothetical protein
MSGTSASSFHRMVVEDVIKNIREEFINEGVDEQVLEELKQVSPPSFSLLRLKLHFLFKLITVTLTLFHCEPFYTLPKNLIYAFSLILFLYHKALGNQIGASWGL